MHCVRKVTEDLYWVGSNDRRLELFENIFPIQKGVSYNSYLLLDEKTVLFDTVDNAVGRQFLENIAAVLNGRTLDYLVINHMEPDHCALIELPPVYENLSAVDNLKVRTWTLGISDARILEVLDIVDLKNTGKKQVGKFSMGMKQRLGIAVALLNDPDFLILDEPANGLDPFGIRQLREMLVSFAESGMTVLVSSHILGEIQQTADYIGILANGVLGYQGGQQENLEELFTEIVSRNRG